MTVYIYTIIRFKIICQNGALMNLEDDALTKLFIKQHNSTNEVHF